MERELLAALDPTVRIIGLHVLRVLAMVWLLPIFGEGSVGRVHKMGFALVIGCTIAEIRGIDLSEDPGADPMLLTTALVREALFGFLMGWVVLLVFDVLRVAGGLIATEMGLNLANQVDPFTNNNQSLIANLFIAAGYVLFFQAGGHIHALNGLLQSFDAVPPGSFAPGPEMATTLVEFTKNAFIAGVRMAAPVFFILIVVTICVGILGKVAPQLHILEASWPIRILSALSLLILFMEPVYQGFDRAIEIMGNDLMTLVHGG